MKRCSKCGVTKEFSEFRKRKASRDGLQSLCKTCSSEGYKQWYAENSEKKLEYSRQWYAENSERHRENGRQWYAENSDKHLERNRKWRAENLDKVREMSRRWYVENREEKLEKNREWREENPDKMQEYSRKWREENPEKERMKVARRRAKKASLPNNFTEEQWQNCLDHFDHRCAYCGKRPVIRVLEKEHWIPQELDGPFTVDNIVPACKRCNCSKGIKMPEVWLEDRPEVIERIQEYFRSVT